MRQFMAVLMIVLMSGAGSNAILSAQGNRLTLPERFGQIPGGAIVKVKLKSKESLRGRLGEVTGTGYAVQVTVGDKVETRQITFDETKSVKHLHASKTGLWVTVGVLGGILATIGILAAVFVAHGG